MEALHIVQIISAQDWFARYRFSEPPYYRLEPLMAWALVEPPGEPGNRWICGYEAGGVMECSHLTDEGLDIFQEYIHSSQIAELCHLWERYGKDLAHMASPAAGGESANAY